MNKKLTIIHADGTSVEVNPVKSWWAGSEEVEKFMPPVSEAIKRYIEWPSAEFTHIYNRAYEAVHFAITEKNKRIESLEAEIAQLKGEG